MHTAYYMRKICMGDLYIECSLDADTIEVNVLVIAAYTSCLLRLYGKYYFFYNIN